MKCFQYNKQNNKNCMKKSCKHFINCKKNNNCIIVAAMDGPKTLQEIGSVFNVTRMRICQIEKDVLKKIKNNIKLEI